MFHKFISCFVVAIDFNGNMHFKRLTISVWTLLHCSSLKKRWCSDIISLLKGMKLWQSPLYSMFVFSTYWHVAMVKIRSQAFPLALLFMLLLLLTKSSIFFFLFHLHIGWSTIYCCNNSSKELVIVFTSNCIMHDNSILQIP